MSLKSSYNGVPVSELKQFLDEKYLQFNNPSFIECDPVSIPHLFTDQKDREIAGFLAATMAWGRRDLILRSCHRLLDMMDNSPYEFVNNAGPDELKRVDAFVHRTFNGRDCISFIKGLKKIYSENESIENIISEGMKRDGSLRSGLSEFRRIFFSVTHEKRAEKHFADVLSGAAGKRLCIFLRWMVRSDNHGVDFGIWKKISPSQLYIPLDLHTGNTARKLGILTRKQNDWKAVEELTAVLRCFDPADPVKYDFALFGLGVSEGF
jgi:uncharacterized protein (TIGR02757 family)